MSDLVKIDTARGPVELSRQIVKHYFCPAATDQEVDIFIKLCVYQKLNPFLRQACLVKYGNRPATMVVGWHVFLERAEDNPNFNGYEVEVYDQDDKPYRGRATQVISHATAKVYRKDRKYPTEVTVLFKEYCVRDDRGQPQASWAKIPVTMIRKVALEQALREAFTKDFDGLYGPEEMGIAEELPDEALESTAVQDALMEPNDDIHALEVEEEEAQVSPPAQVRVATPPVATMRVGPAVIAPLTATKFLTDLYGVAWPRQQIDGKSVGEHYFGRPIKTNNDLAVLAKADKAAWDAGIKRLLADVEAQRNRPA